MGASLTLPKESISNLKCNKCNKYLSVSPISGIKGSYSCGRCEPNEPANELYEEIAQHFLFPCSNESCKEQLIWANVKQHEEQCIYTMVKCPVPECEQLFEIRKALSHFDTDHKDLKFSTKISSNSFRLKEITSDYTVYCLSYKSYVFFATALIEQTLEGTLIRYKCGFIVYTYGDTPDNIKYMITINTTSSKEDNKTIAKKNQPIQRYKADKPISPNKFLPITRFRNFSSTNATTLQYDIEIYESSVEPEPVPDDPNEELARILECPVCSEYMSGQIFNCSTGHSICGACTKCVKQCPYCQGKMTNSRNYVLEDLAVKTKIRCCNKLEGCDFVCEIKYMKVHEECCNY